MGMPLSDCALKHVCVNRQHIGGHQGGQQLRPALQIGALQPPVGPGQAGLTKGSVHPWVPESGSRHFVEARAGEWRIWREFGQVEVDLFASQTLI